MTASIDNYLKVEFTRHSENDLLNQVMFYVLCNSRYQKDKNDQRVKSFSIISKKAIMQKLNTTRHMLDLTLSYLEGAGIIKVENHKKSVIKITVTGQAYMQFIKENKTQILTAMLDK